MKKLLIISFLSLTLLGFSQQIEINPIVDTKFVSENGGIPGKQDIRSNEK